MYFEHLGQEGQQAEIDGKRKAGCENRPENMNRGFVGFI
jgi:hypothetical protein